LLLFQKLLLLRLGARFAGKIDVQKNERGVGAHVTACLDETRCRFLKRHQRQKLTGASKLNVVALFAINTNQRLLVRWQSGVGIFRDNLNVWGRLGSVVLKPLDGVAIRHIDKGSVEGAHVTAVVQYAIDRLVVHRQVVTLADAASLRLVQNTTFGITNGASN